MNSNLGIKDMLNLAIAMEDDGVRYYTAMAEKSGEYHGNMMYKPRADKLVWSEDKGFYIELAKTVLGSGYTDFYNVNKMPDNITHQDSANFYYGLGKRVIEDVKSVLLGMANDEKRHAEIFKRWLASVDDEADSSAFSPEATEFFKEHSKNMKFDPKDKTPASIAAALEDAIETEGGAVEFYSGMLKYANPEIAEMLTKIVNEEKGHKTKLELQKAKLDALTK